MRLYRAVPLGVGIGVAIVAIVVVVEHRPREAPAGARSLAKNDPIAVLQRDVELLKGKIAQPRIVLVPSEKSRAEQAAPAPPADDTRSPAGDAVSPQASPSEQAAATARILEAHYTSEPIDQAWSDNLRAELDGVLGPHTGTTMSSTRCAASLCKVSLVHETAQVQNELASHIASLPGLSAGVYYHYEDGAEPPRTVLYVVRDGHDLTHAMAARSQL
jgi:hypothetical protein